MSFAIVLLLLVGLPLLAGCVMMLLIVTGVFREPEAIEETARNYKQSWDSAR
jgi:formate hydrogenlyase subunit 3/multisubunit Na+/H+ antiporter MnhD subunit